MSAFRDAFVPMARRVRAALAVRCVLDAVTSGAAAGALVALGLARVGKPPWLALAPLFCGAAVGLGAALRRRWSDTDVALYLDARQGGNESITTALEAHARTEVLARVESDAVHALTAASPRNVTPRVVFPRHAVFALAVLVLTLAPRMVPVAQPPAPPATSGVARVHLEPKALARVEALRALSARTAEERARLETLAEQARKLNARAGAGVERREALDALARLHDGIDRERVASRTSPGGREAAARALARRAETRDAAQAIGRLDFVAFDQEMERLARSLEARSRKLAQEALDEAHEAARAHADGALADAIDEQRRLLKRRAERSAAFDELSRLLERALPEDARRKLSRLDRASTDSAEALANALASALEGLTPDERERLAKALAQQGGAMQNAGTLSREELDRLVKALSSPGASEALRRELEALAKGEGSETGERERALALAELAVDGAASSVAGADGNQTTSPGQEASDRGGTQGSHTGASPEVAATSFAARAAGRPTGGVPIGEVPGVSAAMPATQTSRSRASALEAAAPREVGAVERSNVPREYREQVGRYFAP